MNITERCNDLIESNRISSTELADALDKNGVMPGFISVNPGKFLTGKMHYVYAHSQSNWPIHEQIRELPADCVIFVDTFGCEDKAVFGDLVAKYILLYQKARGIIVNGLLRDIPDLRKYGFPIWCRGFTPLGCYNLEVPESNEVSSLAKSAKARLQDGIVVCDDSGCTMIEANQVNETLFCKLEMIELQEDIWAYCINTLKWSTYDTVCLRKYLTNSEVLPEFLREKVKQIPFKK